VHVGNLSLGAFAPGDTLQFSKYATLLGNSLIGGLGVRSFTVSNILPGVDIVNPLGFPLDIKVNSQTAEFNMLGVSSPVAGVAPWGTLRGSMVLPPRPEPSTGASPIEFALARPGARVETRVLDFSRRTVRTLDVPGLARDRAWRSGTARTTRGGRRSRAWTSTGCTRTRSRRREA
jgi:hypothetical protein